VIVYAESSAVLAWLLGEASQFVALRALKKANSVVTSSLTAVECSRGVARARSLGRIAAADALAALRLLDVAESSWDVHDLSDDVMARARAALPTEPVRTLDALHLATALIFQEALGNVHLLSFDERIRANALALGLPVVPTTMPE
jgi:predicted nucleic acid-binding protein